MWSKKELVTVCGLGTVTGLNEELHYKKLIKGKVVPIEAHKIYILEDISYKKEPAHVMKRMLERNITDDQIQSYVDNAILCVSQFKGTRLVFFSKEGDTVLTKTADYGDIDWIVKTTWSKHDFDETTEEIIRRAEKICIAMMIGFVLLHKRK